MDDIKFLQNFPKTVSQEVIRARVTEQTGLRPGAWNTRRAEMKWTVPTLINGYLLTVFQLLLSKRHPFYSVLLSEDFTHNEINILYEQLKASKKKEKAHASIAGQWSSLLSGKVGMFALLYRIIDAMTCEGPRFLGDAFLEADDDDDDVSSGLYMSRNSVANHIQAFREQNVIPFWRKVKLHPEGKI